MKDENYLINDSIDGVANYLVSLYFRTGLKYKYYDTKLNRLLTIYKMCTLKYNSFCLKDGFVICEDGHMGVLSGTFSPFNNSMDPFTSEEDGNEIKEELCECGEIKNHLSRIHTHIVNFVYETVGSNKTIYDDFMITDDSKRLVELIFRKFGNWSISDLADAIDEIISNVPIKTTGISYRKYSIDTNEFNEWLKQNRNKFKNNCVFKFIRDFDRLDINKSYECKKSKVKKL